MPSTDNTGNNTVAANIHIKDKYAFCACRHSRLWFDGNNVLQYWVTRPVSGSDLGKLCQCFCLRPSWFSVLFLFWGFLGWTGQWKRMCNFRHCSGRRVLETSVRSQAEKLSREQEILVDLWRATAEGKEMNGWVKSNGSCALECQWWEVENL